MIETKNVLKDINIEIEKGSFTAVLGHNGSGKSTLAKHFNAILLPSGGKVYVKGMDTADENNIFNIRQSAGMVFQNPDNQMVAALVEDEVAFAPENLGVEPKEIRRRVDECLEIVNMTKYAQSSPSKLSGGQKQRVAIASVLAMNPEILILDEPTAMLDPKGRSEVIKTIKMLNEEKDITVVLITHYMDEAAQADRTVVIDDGEIVLDGTPKEVFKNVEKLKSLGLDVPQVTELAYELRKMGIEISDDVNYIYQQGMPFERQALYDVNIEIEDGSLVALIGHTGSGKSTLIQHFNALVKPTSGKIIINGIDVTAPKADLRLVRKTVGLVFQYPEHQLFEETVYKDIAFGPKNMGFSDEKIDKRVRESAALVGLKEKHLMRSPFDLSGGQKRRVAIAGVLAMNPKVLILDEPTAGLDPKGRDEILATIKKLHEENKEMIIIFVSHSMEDVAKTAERVIVMNDGHVEMQGTVAEVFAQAEHLQKIGLNVPQVTLLTDKLRLAGYDLPEHIYTVKYAADAIKKLIGGGGNV